MWNAPPSGLVRRVGRRLAACLAIAGLLLRVVIGAWHVHPDTAASAPPSIERIGPLAAGAPAPENPSPTAPAGLHDCAICFTLSLAGMAGGPAAPSLVPAQPQSRVVLATGAHELAGLPRVTGFRSRAPPSA
jgi:hypothetical protein